MEMQENAAMKKQRKEETTTKQPMLEVDAEGNPYTLTDGPPSAEEAGQGHYTGLKKPSEDIYSDISEPTKRSAKQAQGAMKPYRVACLILTVLCLVLLLVVVVLLVKMKTGSTACPVNPVSWLLPKCNVEQCRAFTSQDRNRCYCCHQCPHGWVRLDQSCFFFSTFRLNWDESVRNCSGEGGALVVVGSQKVQNFLTQNGNGMKYWIALRINGNGEGRKWEWLDTEVQQTTSLQQSYWGVNETHGRCAILNSNDLAENNWMKSPCDSFTYYICQKRL